MVMHLFICVFPVWISQVLFITHFRQILQFHTRLILQANSTNSINLTSVKSYLETPANTIANNGIRIISTAKISVYYDVVGTSSAGRIQNTEIFVLKGRYAMGQKFYTPIQNSLTNASDENGYSGFDIVATEDNTTVTITPTAALIWRPCSRSDI